ncbi:hypothetical protein ACIBAC_28945 [Streptomyces sp. NPDC051362]|uniref:hypothetical protein n=1 Tax=Streptomyces sp. NPDC051362 TaxID=3365651 RepID=UPI0037AA779C
MASDTSLVFNLVARDQTSEQLGSMKEKFSSAGTAIGAALGVGVGAAFASGLDMQATQSKLQAQLGLTATESSRIGKVAGGLYADAYGGSLEEVDTAVGSVISSIHGMRDASSKDLETATASALNFASTFDIEVDRAVQSVGTLMNSGLAKSSTQAFDLITAASQRVPASLREDVLDASDEYSQFFNTLGYSGEEAFSLLVDASKKGTIGIDKAGDAIKEFTIRSTDMSASSQTAYKSIGLDAHEMSNAILKGGDSAHGATQKIINGLLGIKDPSKQANTAIALFGTPIEDLNVKDIPAFLKSLSGASGSMDGFGGAAKRSGDALNDNAKTALTSFQRHATMAATQAAGSFITFAMKYQEVFGPLAALLGGVALAVLAVGAAQKVYAAYTAIASAAQTIWNAEIWASTAALLANPMTWIVIAIIALIAVIVLIATKTTWFQTAWAAMTAAVGVAWDWLWAKIQQGWALLVTLFTNFTIVGLIIKHWDTIKNGTVTAWHAVTGFVKAIPGRLTGYFLNWTLPGLIIKHWSTIKSRTVSIATGLVSWVSGLPGRLIGVLSSLGGRLSSLGSSAFNRFRSAVVSRANSAVSYIHGVPSRARNALGSLGGLLYASGRSLLQGFVNGIKSMVNAPANAVKSSLSRARNLLPFSPAKEGPFSGKGWTLYSGHSLMTNLAQGIRDRSDEPRTAMADALGATATTGQQALSVAPPQQAAPMALGGLGARVIVDVRGADEDLKRLFRKIVRVDGRGSTQTAFGRNR